MVKGFGTIGPFNAFEDKSFAAAARADLSQKGYCMYCRVAQHPYPCCPRLFEAKALLASGGGKGKSPSKGKGGYKGRGGK